MNPEAMTYLENSFVAEEQRLASGRFRHELLKAATVIVFVLFWFDTLLNWSRRRKRKTRVA